MASQSIPQKRCAKCGELFPATPDHFHRQRSHKDGLASYCKSCNSGHSAKWQAENRDRRNATGRASYRRNPQARKESIDKCKAKKPDYYHALNIKWNKNHRDSVRVSGRKHYQTHRAEKLIYHRLRRINNGKHVRTLGAAISQKRRSRMKQADGSFTQQDILDLYAEQNQRCAYCGILITFDIPKDVHVDHVIPLSRGGSNWPDNLALTCQACNLSKGSKTLAEWRAVRGW